MFSMKEPPTSPKFNSVNEKSVVENSGVYEFLERQYKVHWEKERVNRIRESGNTYRYWDFKNEEDLMLLDTSHRDINEKSHNKSRKGSKIFKNKNRNN